MLTNATPTHTLQERLLNFDQTPDLPIHLFSVNRLHITFKDSSSYATIQLFIRSTQLYVLANQRFFKYKFHKREIHYIYIYL